MNLIINIASLATPAQSTRRARSAPTVSRTAEFNSAPDSVDFSSTARGLAKAVEESTFRIARVRAIRSQITNGTYITSERLDGTVARLLDVLG